MASSRPVARGSRKGRIALRLAALVYLAFLLVIPVGLIFWRTFENGVGPVIDALTEPDAIHAFKLTFKVAFLAVLGNGLFGVTAAMLLVRGRFPGKRVFDALIDLPMAVSPVVVGLSLILVYGRLTTVGGWFADQGINIIFSTPGMVMATMFVSLPLVVREVAPVLEEIGTEQEQAAWTLGANGVQTFRRITLPSIRWAVAYGVVLVVWHVHVGLPPGCADCRTEQPSPRGDEARPHAAAGQAHQQHRADGHGHDAVRADRECRAEQQTDPGRG